MNRSQRIVVVVALGVGIAVVVATFSALTFETRGGWFGYAPGTDLSVLSAAAYEGARSDAVGKAAAWLVGVVIWAGASVSLLRSSKDDSN